MAIYLWSLHENLQNIPKICAHNDIAAVPIIIYYGYNVTKLIRNSLWEEIFVNQAVLPSEEIFAIWNVTSMCNTWPKNNMDPTIFASCNFC